MSDYAEIFNAGDLRYRRHLAARPDQIWPWIAEGNQRALWLADGFIGAAPGEKIEFIFDHKKICLQLNNTPPEKYKDAAKGASMSGEILIYDEPSCMKFTWPERSGGVTYVTIKLRDETKNDVISTQLELSHEGIIEKSDLIGAAAGWHVHLRILADRIAGRDPAPFWPEHTALEKEYEMRVRDV